MRKLSSSGKSIFLSRNKDLSSIPNITKKKKILLDPCKQSTWPFLTLTAFKVEGKSQGDGIPDPILYHLNDARKGIQRDAQSYNSLTRVISPMRLAKFLEMWKHLEIEGSKETGTLTYFIIKNMVGWKVIRYNFFLHDTNRIHFKYLCLLIHQIYFLESIHRTHEKSLISTKKFITASFIAVNIGNHLNSQQQSNG